MPAKQADEVALTVSANDSSMPIFDAKKPDFNSLVIEPLFQDQVDFETLFVCRIRRKSGYT